jgi:hypothetical protein
MKNTEPNKSSMSIATSGSTRINATGGYGTELHVRLLPEKGKASFINEAAANTVYDIHAAQNYLSTFLRN